MLYIYIYIIYIYIHTYKTAFEKTRAPAKVLAIYSSAKLATTGQAARESFEWEDWGI